MPSPTVTLGRVAAIPIRLHWSWLLVFGLLAVAVRPTYAGLVCGGFRACGPDLGLAALLGALIGASVLLHELGHALVAARLTVRVQSITLFAFGGVAEMGEESPDPGAELAIAVAGPLVSLLIAATCGALWWARGGLAGGDAVALLAAHIGLSNLVIALFNLLPSYPMDGGRVLRAALWFLNDDLLPATRIASEVGRACGIAVGLGGCGLALAARQPLVALWSVVVGVFLFRTATTSHRQTMLQAALQGVRVADLMQRRLQTVSGDLTLEQFVARYVLGQAETGFAVVEPPDGDADPRLLGLITLRNLRRFTTAQWSQRRVGEVMTPASQVLALAPDTPAFDALYALNASPDGLLPVTEDARLVGMLRHRDLALFVQMQTARRR